MTATRRVSRSVCAHPADFQAFPIDGSGTQAAIGTDRDSFPYDTVIVDEVYKVDDKSRLIYIAIHARGCCVNDPRLKENRYFKSKDMVRTEEVFVCLPSEMEDDRQMVSSQNS